MKPSEVLEKYRQAIRDATGRPFGFVASGEDRLDCHGNVPADTLPAIAPDLVDKIGTMRHWGAEGE